MPLGLAADRPALIVIVRAEIPGQRRHIGSMGGALQGVIWNVEAWKDLVGIGLATIHGMNLHQPRLPPK
jgi:hypothetical protein